MQNKTPSVTPQHVKAFYILGVQRWKKTTYNYVDWNMHGHATKKKDDYIPLQGMVVFF